MTLWIQVFGSALPELNGLGQRQKSNKILAPHRRAETETKPSETTVLMKRWIIRQRMVSYLKRLCRAGEALWKMKPFLVVLLFQGKTTLEFRGKRKNPSPFLLPFRGCCNCSDVDSQQPASWMLPGVCACASSRKFNRRPSTTARHVASDWTISPVCQSLQRLQAISNVHPYLFQSESAMSAACQPKIPPKAEAASYHSGGCTVQATKALSRQIAKELPLILPGHPGHVCAHAHTRLALEDGSCTVSVSLTLSLQ